MEFNDNWLKPGVMIPVDIATSMAFIAEIIKLRGDLEIAKLQLAAKRSTYVEAEGE